MGREYLIGYRRCIKAKGLLCFRSFICIGLDHFRIVREQHSPVIIPGKDSVRIVQNVINIYHSLIAIIRVINIVNSYRDLITVRGLPLLALGIRRADIKGHRFNGSHQRTLGQALGGSLALPCGQRYPLKQVRIIQTDSILLVTDSHRLGGVRNFLLRDGNYRNALHHTRVKSFKRDTLIRPQHANHVGRTGLGILRHGKFTRIFQCLDNTPVLRLIIEICPIIRTQLPQHEVRYLIYKCQSHRLAGLTFQFLNLARRNNNIRIIGV